MRRPITLLDCELALILAVVLLGAAPAVRAADVGGSVDLVSSSTDSDGIESDTEQQRYSLWLSQELAPFLRLQMTYGLQDLESQFTGTEPLSRRSESPVLNLTYRRPTVAAFLSLSERTIETTTGSQDLDSDSVIASVTWRPRSDFSFFGDFRDQSSVADVSVFGRESNVRSYGARASYNRRFWSAAYSLTRTDYDSGDRFRSEQDRQEVTLGANRSFFRDRLSVSFLSNLSRLERQDDVLAGADLATPIPAVEGLYAVDTTPELGELNVGPDLIDGDTRTPAFPFIDIGGAATFRNLGLDLGLIVQVTRLEIFVAGLSGREVIWQVYESPDNFVWNAVDGVTSEFDEGRLLYELRFPQTTSRYIKAVNVSANSQPVVRVTELRALVDVEPDATTSDSTSDRYRLGLNVSYRPTERVRINADAGGSNDEDVSDGLVRRDYTERYHGASVVVSMPQDLRLQVGYRFEDVEDLREPVLMRTVDTLSALLGWTPLPTVEAILTARRREESEVGDVLQVNDSVGLRVLTELLPTLRLTTDLRVTDVMDRLSGVSRETRTFEERFEAQPLASWSLSGSYRYSSFDVEDGLPLSDQHRINLFTQWRLSAYLLAAGSWSWLVDDETFLQQFYSISYMPGKLRLAGSFQESATRNGVSTQLSTVTLGYRLNRHVRLDSALSTSQTKGSEVTNTESTTLGGRLRVSF